MPRKNDTCNVNKTLKYDLLFNKTHILVKVFFPQIYSINLMLEVVNNYTADCNFGLIQRKLKWNIQIPKYINSKNFHLLLSLFYYLLNPSLEKTLDAACDLIMFWFPFFIFVPKRELNETRPIRLTNLLTSGPFFRDKRLFTDFLSSSDFMADTFNGWPFARFTACFSLTIFFVRCKRAFCSNLSFFEVRPRRARILSAFTRRIRLRAATCFLDSISRISSVDENFTDFSPVSMRSASYSSATIVAALAGMRFTKIAFCCGFAFLMLTICFVNIN